MKGKCKAEGAQPFKRFWKTDNWKSTSTPQFGNKVPKDGGESSNEASPSGLTLQHQETKRSDKDKIICWRLSGKST